MNDNTEDLEEAIERASLLPSRYYIVIRDSEEEEGTLKMIAYDTTKEEEDDEYIPAGVVLLSGIMELIESDFERVMNAGMARISFQTTQQDMLEEVCKEEATVEHLPNSNIVKINFGKVQ